MSEAADGSRGVEDDGNYRVTMEGTGRCRRYPPSTRRHDWQPDSHDSADAAHGAFWPVTWDDDWCGEFDAAVKVVV